MIYGGWFRNKMEKPIPGYKEYQTKDKGKGLYNKYSAESEVTLLYEGEVVSEDSFKENRYCVEIFGKKVKEIGNNCFYNCHNLKKVFLPKVTKIGHNCFSNCELIKSIKLPQAIYIGNGAFSRCPELTEISDLNIIKASGSLFESCYKLEKISLPKATEIDYYAFAACSSLKFLSIPSATELKNGCFSGCDKLQEIKCGRNMRDKVREALKRDSVSHYISINEVY